MAAALKQNTRRSTNSRSCRVRNSTRRVRNSTRRVRNSTRRVRSTRRQQCRPEKGGEPVVEVDTDVLVKKLGSIWQGSELLTDEKIAQDEAVAKETEQAATVTAAKKAQTHVAAAIWKKLLDTDKYPEQPISHTGFYDSNYFALLNVDSGSSNLAFKIDRVGSDVDTIYTITFTQNRSFSSGSYSYRFNLDQLYTFYDYYDRVVLGTAGPYCKNLVHPIHGPLYGTRYWIPVLGPVLGPVGPAARVFVLGPAGPSTNTQTQTHALHLSPKGSLKFRELARQKDLLELNPSGSSSEAIEQTRVFNTNLGWKGGLGWEGGVLLTDAKIQAAEEAKVKKDSASNAASNAARNAQVVAQRKEWKEFLDMENNQYFTLSDQYTTQPGRQFQIENKDDDDEYKIIFTVLVLGPAGPRTETTSSSSDYTFNLDQLYYNKYPNLSPVFIPVQETLNSTLALYLSTNGIKAVADAEKAKAAAEEAKAAAKEKAKEAADRKAAEGKAAERKAAFEQGEDDRAAARTAFMKELAEKREREIEQLMLRMREQRMEEERQRKEKRQKKRAEEEEERQRKEEEVKRQRKEEEVERQRKEEERQKQRAEEEERQRPTKGSLEVSIDKKSKWTKCFFTFNPLTRTLSQREKTVDGNVQASWNINSVSDITPRLRLFKRKFRFDVNATKMGMGNSVTIRLNAANNDEKQKWVTAIENTINSTPKS